MHINWKHCPRYEDARNETGIIYLHEWHGKPFYWGKAHHSYFGGHMRAHENGGKVSGRYNSGYRHWIEGCLRHGAKLYTGKLDEAGLARIDEIENFLIHHYYDETVEEKDRMNRKDTQPCLVLDILHTGDIPATIRNHTPHGR